MHAQRKFWPTLARHESFLAHKLKFRTSLATSKRGKSSWHSFRQMPACGINNKPHAPKTRGRPRHGAPSESMERLMTIAPTAERAFFSFLPAEPHSARHSAQHRLMAHRAGARVAGTRLACMERIRASARRKLRQPSQSKMVRQRAPPRSDREAKSCQPPTLPSKIKEARGRIK